MRAGSCSCTVVLSGVRTKTQKSQKKSTGHKEWDTKKILESLSGEEPRRLNASSKD